MNLIFAVVCAASGIVGMALLLWRLFRCPHAWELVDKTEFPSPLEIYKLTGVEYPSVWPSQILKMSARTVVLVIRCPKCGAAEIKKATGTT
jgi:hypothetical protein